LQQTKKQPNSKQSTSSPKAVYVGYYMINDAKCLHTPHWSFDLGYIVPRFVRP